VVPVDLVAHHHVERCGGGAEFTETAGAETVSVRTPVHQLMNRPGIAVEGEDDIDIGGEGLGELLGAHTVRVVLRAVERHQVDHVHKTNLQLRQPGLEDLRCGDRLDGDHIAGRGEHDVGFGMTQSLGAGPLPDAVTAGAVLDCLVHVEPLRLRLLVLHDQVDVVA